MAKIYGEIASSALMTFDKSFARSNGQPLDSTEIFYSLTAAETYAAGEVAYVGQKIVVLETVDDVTTVTHYGIEPDNSLKELGSSPVGDTKSIVVAEDGTVSLAGVAGLEFSETNDEGETVAITYQPLMTSAGLTWVRPSATTVEGLATEIEGLKTNIGTIEDDIEALEGKAHEHANKELLDTYTQTEIDLQSAVEQKHSHSNKSALDDIRSERIRNWDSAYNDSHTHENSSILNKITSDHYLDWNEAASRAHGHGNLSVLQGISNNKITAWDSAETNAKTYADGLNTAMDTRVKAIEDDYLKAADKTELSEAIADAEESAVNRVLGYLAEEEVNTSYDTLKEVAAWIESDTTNSSQLITRVDNIEKDYLKGADKAELQGAIDDLEAFVGALPEGAASATVVAYIQEVVDALKIGDYAKAVDLTALAGRVEALEGKAHEHTNADVINGITAEKVSAWDAAEQNAKDYADDLNEAVSETLDGKVAIEEGKSLIADTLISKLEGVEEGAQVNKIESVDETQFALDAAKNLTLLDIAMSKVTGLDEALADKVAKEDGSRLINANEIAKLAKLVIDEETGDVGLSGTISAENVVGLDNMLDAKVDKAEGKSLIADTLIAKVEAIEAGAQVNKIETVSLNGTALEIVEKAVNIPMGAGLKASAEITMADDGALGIGSVGVSKLANEDGITLVLDGGSAD